MSLHVVLAGGGTAGHIEPALNLADALRRRDPGIGITALGTARGLETTLVPARGYDLELIPAVPLPRKPSKDLLTLPGRVRGAVRAVTAVLDGTGAGVLVGFGGYVALPAYLGARRRKVPLVVHEANARPGLANRVGARFAAAVAETVPGSMRGATLTGLPLRPAIVDLDRVAARHAALAHFGLHPDRPTLLVFGGSQGARHLNEVLAATLAAAAADGADAFDWSRIQILHAVGPNQDHEGAAAPGPPDLHRVALPYIDRMDLAYAAADLALCRAGAMTVAELSRVGLPAVYVPLPIGNGEQRLNAEPVVARGGGLLIADADLDVAAMRRLVLPLLIDEPRRDTMGAAARAAAGPDAGDLLVDLVLGAADRAGTR